MFNQRTFWKVSLIIAATVVASALPQLHTQSKQFSTLVIDSTCSSFAEVTMRQAASAFTLSYDSPHSYFGDDLDPIAVKDNPPDRPWWILRTKGKIVWQGHHQATNSGILIGGNWLQHVTKSGHEFIATHGSDMLLLLAHEKDLARSLGVGSEAKFDSSWVPLCGNQYRMGGFRVSSNGVEFLSGTEGRQGDTGQVFKFDGTSWKPLKRK